MGDDTIKKNISKNITKYREQAGMSQKELAKRLGVAPSRVSNWETYANCPTIDILFEVCNVLNVSINDIYGVYPDSKFILQYEEQELIKKYRVLDEHGKQVVNTILNSEYEKTASDDVFDIDEDITIACDIINCYYYRTSIYKNHVVIFTLNGGVPQILTRIPKATLKLIYNTAPERDEYLYSTSCYNHFMEKIFGKTIPAHDEMLYQNARPSLNAAHKRTDIPVTDADVEFDDDLLDDDNF